MAKGKYDEWRTNEGLLKIEGWARDGLIDEQIAHNIGISRKTLNEWKNKYSDIRNALKKGKEVVDIEVENALLKNALGYDYEETTIEVDSKGKKRKKIITKHVQGDTTAQIFWLRNRKPHLWRDTRNIAVTAEDSTKLDAIMTQLGGEGLEE